MPHRILATTLVLFLAAACSTPTPPPPPPPVATPAGELALTVTGLPDGVDANVWVNGPDGFHQRVNHTTTLKELAPGDYRVLPAAVTSQASAYAPDGEPVTVTLGQAGASAKVGYHPVKPRLAPLARPLTAQAPKLSAAQLDDTGGTLTFGADAPGIQALEVGHVVALGITPQTPQGYLGKVTAVHSGNGTVTLETTRATLADALVEGALNYDKPVRRADVAATEILADGVTMPQPLVIRDVPDAQGLDGFCPQFDHVKVAGGSTGALYLSGSGCLSAWPALALWVEDGKVHGYVGSQGVINGQFRIEGEGTVSEFVRSALPLLKIKLSPVEIEIGELPVIFYPEIIVNVEVGVSITGDFTVEVKEHLDWLAGARYDGSNWRGESSGHQDGSLITSGAVSAFSARAGLGPELDVYLYGVLGGTIGADGYVQFDATLGQRPWWTLSLGLDVFVGAKLSLFGYWTLANLQLKVLDVAVPIAHAPLDQSGPVIIQLSPRTAALQACQRQPFTATISGEPNPSVTWRATGGTFEVQDATHATYVAAAHPGTYQVDAVSRTQPGQYDKAKVQVTGEGASMLVLVSGLPAGLAGNVTVAGGPHGFSKVIGQTTSFDCLETGDFAITAAAVTDEQGRVWTPNFAQNPPQNPAVDVETLTAGAHPQVAIGYQHVPGTLRIAVQGAPAGQPLAVKVTGPGGYTHTTTTADDLLQLLEPGTYTVTAPDIGTGPDAYKATPPTQQVQVLPMSTVTASVTYASGGAKGLYVLTSGGRYTIAHFADPAGGVSNGIAKGMTQGCMGCASDFAFDASGHLWTSDRIVGALLEYDHGTLTSDPSPALQIPVQGGIGALAFDGHGNLWVARTVYGQQPPAYVERYDAATLTSAGATPSLSLPLADATPNAFAFDPQGNLWLFAREHVHEYAAASLTTDTLVETQSFAPGTNLLDAVFDGAGNLWVASATSATAWKVAPAAYQAGTLTASATVSGFDGYPTGLAFDPQGNLFISFRNGHTQYATGVQRVPAASLGGDVVLPPGDSVDGRPFAYDYSFLMNAGKPRWLAQ